MRVEASRCLLRHEGRAYGSQQARKLSNALACEKGTLSDAAKLHLLPSPECSVVSAQSLNLVSLANKGWARDGGVSKTLRIVPKQFDCGLQANRTGSEQAR